MAEAIRSSNLPKIKVPAGTTVFRKIHTARTSLVDSAGRTFQEIREPGKTTWRPDVAALMRIDPASVKKDHRWSGMLPNGGAGIGGSYWGSMHGVLAEDFFYNVANIYSPPSSGFVSPRYAPLVVQGRQNLEKFIADLPTTVPVNGGGLSDILIGVFTRDVFALDVHPASEWFREWSGGLSRDLSKELGRIGYDRLDQGLFDADDRALSRLVGNVASDRGETAIHSPSVRQDDMTWSVGYDKDLANNVAMLGAANQSLSPIIDLRAVLEIRPHPTEGVCAQVAPVGSAYPEGQGGGTLVDQLGNPLSGA